MIRRILFLLLFPLTVFGQMTVTKFFMDGKYPGVVYRPSTWQSTKKYPAVFFYHGDGEKGNGTDAGLNKLVGSSNHANLLLAGERYGFIVIAPQLVPEYQAWQSGWTRDYMRRYYEYAFKTLNIDTNYFYVTGLSLGGGGAWTTICDPVWSKKIAAAVPICGTPQYENDFLQPALNAVAVWAHHAKNDPTVNIIASQNQVRYINEKSPLIPAKLTEYNSGGHAIWGSVYGNDSIYKWMASYKKGQPPVIPPVTPGKKVTNTIIIYNDGSIQVIPVDSTPQPPTAQRKLNLVPCHVFDQSQARKNVERLFDKDTLTPAFQDFFNGYIIEPTGGQILWVVLDSFVNNVKLELFNELQAAGGKVDFQLYYDFKDTTRKSMVYNTTLPSGVWKPLDLPWNDSCRLIKIRIADFASNRFNEVKVHASMLGPAPPVLPPTANKPPDEGRYFMGYNKLSIDTTTDDAGYSQRNINDGAYLMPDPLKADGKTLSINRYGNSIELTYKPAKSAGRKSYLCVSALREGYKYPPYYNNDSKDMPRGVDSTKPESWISVRTAYYGLAAKMGSKNADISQYTFINTPPEAGLAMLEEIEVGNEDDARWAGPLRFHAALVKLRKLEQGYAGIKAADPTLKVISGAITGIDTSYLKAMYLAGQFLKWATYPFDVIAVNEYCTNAGGQHAGTSDGVSPERFQLYEKLTALIRTRDRYYPGKPVYITEIGYDIHDGSNYDVPVITGQSREQTKAMWGLRGFEIGAAALVSRMYWYTQEQGGGGDFSTTGFTKPYQKPDGSWSTQPVDLYWYMTCRAIVLKDYKAWPVIIRQGDSTGVWILKYSHVSDSRKSVISFWHGTHNNTVLANYAISVSGVSALLFTPEVGIKQGRQKSLSISSGTVPVSVTECPQYIIVTT